MRFISLAPITKQERASAKLARFNAIEAYRQALQHQGVYIDTPVSPQAFECAG